MNFKVFQAFFFSTLLFSQTFSKRHSRVQKRETTETPQQARHTTDKSLATILKKQTKNMAFDEALQAKEYYIKEKEADMIIKCGERLLALGGDQEVLRKTRFELAEVCFEKENNKEAQKHAEAYLTYYPGAQETKKVAFIGIKASFRSQEIAERDQEKTKKTISLAQNFLDTYPTDTEYSSEIRTLLQQSYQKLIRSELAIIDTHLNAYNYNKNPAILDAVNKRIAYLKEHYLTQAPATEKRILETEIKIAQARGDQSLLTEKKAARAAFTSSEPLRVTQTDKRSYMSRSWKAVKGIFSQTTDEYFA